MQKQILITKYKSCKILIKNQNYIKFWMIVNLLSSFSLTVKILLKQFQLVFKLGDLDVQYTMEENLNNRENMLLNNLKKVIFLNFRKI